MFLITETREVQSLSREQPKSTCFFLLVNIVFLCLYAKDFDSQSSLYSVRNREHVGNG